MTSPGSKRAAPTRTFEHYTLTRIIDKSAGLTDISDSTFVLGLGPASVTDADNSAGSANIGFDFEFDGITYKTITVSTNGWIELNDPAAAPGALVYDVLVRDYDNTTILSTIPSNSTLLCPWFDDLTNQTSNIANLYLPNEIEQEKYGYIGPPLGYSPVAYSCVVYRHNSGSQGRRTIIRFNSLSVNLLTSFVIQFEVVLYENGRIEFNYVPKSSLKQYVSEIFLANGATIGIFAPGSNRFRDFAPDLGPALGASRGDPSPSRRIYKYGGAIYDPGINPYIYETALTINDNWPAPGADGATFRFEPPKNRKKILPRKCGVTLDQVPRYPQNSVFSDNRSVAFVSGVIVNYPTTLQRFYAGTLRETSNQEDLFLQSDHEFEITASIIKSLASPFIEQQRSQNLCAPFNEVNLPEQAPDALTNTFYVSGSIIGNVIDQPLRSKKQFNITLPVVHKTTLFERTSSIYYYNGYYQKWMLPQNTTRDGGSDLTTPQEFIGKNDLTEDYRGFGPIGNMLASGSQVPGINGVGTDYMIGKIMSHENFSRAITRNYAGSVTQNSAYNFTDEELLNFSVDEPFLLEKVVFDVPIEAGPGWFKDVTTSLRPEIDTFLTFDFAGPGLTVALFNETEWGSERHRDLVISGTITHINDMTSSLTMSALPGSGFELTPVLRPVGYLAYASSPGAIIHPDVNNTFTGSVSIQSEATETNGVIAYMWGLYSGSNPTTNLNEFKRFIARNEFKIKPSAIITDNIGTVMTIDGIKPFGRAMTGFESSGRAVFGGSYVTSQGVLKNNKIINPFYLTGSQADYYNTLVQASGAVELFAAVPLTQHIRSPYLIMPGDRLGLAFAKTRPIMTGAVGIDSSLHGHDIKLSSGSINIRMYGTVLRNAQPTEYHNGENATRAFNRTIGSLPIDQFDVAYRGEFIGGMSDDYVTGSLVAVKTVDGKPSITTGYRGRVFSKYDARSQPVPDESPGETATNSSKAFRTQPWWERVGNVRNMQITDSSERIYDSMMPMINECFGRNGAHICLFKNQSINPDLTTIGDPHKVTSSSLGYIILDGTDVAKLYVYEQELSNTIVDRDWSHGFPFESRYSGIKRVKNIIDSFTTSYLMTGSEGGITVGITNIPTTRFNGLFIGSFTHVPDTFLSWVSDVNVSSLNGSGYFPTSSAGTLDLSKHLFGIGDLNARTYQINSEGNYSWIGSQNRVDYRDYDITDPNTYVYSADGFLFGSIVRGWKYGVYSGVPAYSKTVFRRNHFGQFRDMLEQRIDTRIYSEISPEDKALGNVSIKEGLLEAPVQKRFFDSTGVVTTPAYTAASNLSNECTSSLPFFDGVVRNREDPLDLSNINTVTYAVV